MTLPRKGPNGKPLRAVSQNIGAFSDRLAQCTCNCCIDICCGNCETLDYDNNIPASLDVSFSSITNCGTRTMFTARSPGGNPICDEDVDPSDTEVPCTALNGTTYNCTATFSRAVEEARTGCEYEYYGSEDPYCWDQYPWGGAPAYSAFLGTVYVNVEIHGGTSGDVEVYAYTSAHIPASAGTGHPSEGAAPYFPTPPSSRHVCFEGESSISLTDCECSLCEAMPVLVGNGRWSSGSCDETGTYGWDNEGYGGTASVDKG